MLSQEFSASPQGLAGFGKYLQGQLPGMGNDRPDLQLNRNACCLGLFRDARGIVAQTFVRPDVDEQRGKAFQVSVKRGRERVARIGVAKIVARTGADVLAVE